MKNRQRLFFLVVSTIIIVTVFCKIKTNSTKIKTIDATTTTSPITIITTELIEEETEGKVEEEKRVVESVSETKQEIVTEVKIE